VKSNSVDAIVTSPPYSIALDYVKNDEHALDALGVDTKALRGTMTGVRGRGPKQKLDLYNNDMREMFAEVSRVLKHGAQAAFVIGDATVDGTEFTTTGEMAEWAIDAGLKLERTLPKIVFGLYSIMSDEKIMIFRKP
jgi:tRNA G10  N-methylase Trm11